MGWDLAGPRTHECTNTPKKRLDVINLNITPQRTSAWLLCYFLLKPHHGLWNSYPNHLLSLSTYLIGAFYLLDTGGYIQGGVKISEEDRALLVSQFAAPSADDQDDADSVEERKGKEIEEKGGAGGGAASPPSPSVSAMMDYDAFVRWLSEGGGLDDALLRKVQRHLKGRLSK